MEWSDACSLTAFSSLVLSLREDIITEQQPWSVHYYGVFAIQD
jgi:hypothetical protein